jgi:hypothetical protein
MTAAEPITSAPVRDYLLRLQDRICQELEREDGAARFQEDAWSRAEASPPSAAAGESVLGTPRLGEPALGESALGGGRRKREKTHGA